MNSRSILPVIKLVLAAALCAPAFSLASEPAAPAAFPVVTASANDNVVERGASKRMVLEALGGPSVRLTSDVWLYHRHHAVNSPAAAGANQQGCTTLVVAFKQGCISDMKLVNSAGINVIAANLESGPSVKYVADRR